MKTGLNLLLLCFLMLPVRQASGAFASPNVTIIPASDNVYAIQGGDFSDIRRVDITLQYDAAALAGPRVVQGDLAAGATIAVNTSTPGLLQFTLTPPKPIWLRRWTRPESGQLAINGSGTLATATFVRTMNTGADILSLAASAVSGAGQSITVASQVVNAPKTADSGASPEQQAGRTDPGPPPPGKGAGYETAGSGVSPEKQAETATDSGQPAGRTATVAPGSHPATTALVQPSGATSVSPPENPSSREDARAETSSSDSSDPLAGSGVPQEDDHSAVFPETAKAAPDESRRPNTPEPERKKTMLYKSVLERFREFKGEKTPQALIALFTSADGRQDPPIVLSDGKTTVKVVLELHSNAEDNNFLLDGASLISLTKKEGDYWIAELLPEKNTAEATVSVPRNNRWHVAPLTVSPPREAAMGWSSGKPAEADFKLYLYLRERGTAKAPRFDLNGDGRCDYVDDYIFAANYLARQKTAGKNVAKSLH